MRALKHILKSKYLFKILLLLTIIYVALYINFVKRESSYNLEDTIFEGEVVGIKNNEDKNVITIKSNKERLIVYYKEDLSLNYGDTIKVYGKLNEYKDSTIFNLFNYKKYYEYKNIYYYIYADNIEIQRNNTNIINDLKNTIIKRIRNIDKSGKYLMAFILQEKYLIDKNILNSYQTNGISHLFSISGMHISLFSNAIYYFIKKISYNNYINSIIVFIFLLIYLIILDYPVSVIRAIISFTINKINRLFNLNIEKLDIMFIILIIMLLINPFYIFYTSFIFSYTISFFISIFNKNIKKSKYKNLYLSFICFIASLPLVIYNYYSFNIISILLNLLYVPLVSLIIFPLILLTLLFPILDNILYLFIIFLEESNYLINNYLGSYINICVPKPSIYFIILYYIFLLLYKKYNKMLIVLIIMIFTLKFSYVFDNKLKIVYLDVGQGDSTILTYRNETILIDTGSNNYDDIISYMKSIGRTKINYLIITHGDSDHAGSAIEFLNNIKIDTVIINSGNYSDIEKEIISICRNKKVVVKNNLNYLDALNTRIYFLNTKIYSNENDNSIVMYFSYNKYKFLFMGDATKLKEEDILYKYKIRNIDFLKVGHHGSNTSSSKNFIDKISNKYSIISVGKDNVYGHPNNEVLNKLHNSIIYRTDINGSIEVKIYNKKYKIRTCISHS